MADNQVKYVLDTGLASLQIGEREKQAILTSVREGRRVKKKWSAVLVLAAVLLGLTVTALALSALGGFAFLDAHEYGQPLACAVLEDELYVLTLDGLSAWDQQDAAPRLLLRWRELPDLPSPSRVRLMADEELLMMDEQQGKVWAYRDGSMTQLWEQAWTEETIPFRETDDAVCQDGFLFLQTDPVEYDHGSRQSLLYRLDLSSGEVRELRAENLYRITAYRDGALLGMQQEKDGDLILVALDIRTGESREITRMPLGSLKGVTYSAAHDAIFALADGMFSRWTGADWHPICAYALPQLPFFYGVFGESYVTASHEGIQFLPLNGAGEEMQTLIIRGLMDTGDNDHAFQRANPGVSIARQREMHFCAEEAVQAIRQGDEADLFHVMLTSPEEAKLLMEAAPIQSPMLHAEAEQTTPFVRRLLMQDGRLYAVPALLSANGWEVRKNWTGVIPRTFAELLRLHASWTEEGMCVANSYDDHSWSREDFAVYLLMQGIREHRAGELRFTDAAFVEALRQLQAAAFAQQTGDEGTALFTHGTLQLHGAHEGDPESGRRMMPSPVISPGATPSTPVVLNVYVLNPNSSNREAALRYLEWIAGHRAPDEEARLKPDTAQPALHPGVEEWLIASIVQEHRQWEQENGLAHDEAALQARLDNLLSMPDHWAVTQERLNQWRETAAPALRLGAVYPSARHGSREQEMLGVIQQCLQGTIAPEECAEQLEGMMK